MPLGLPVCRLAHERKASSHRRSAKGLRSVLKTFQYLSAGPTGYETRGWSSSSAPPTSCSNLAATRPRRCCPVRRGGSDFTSRPPRPAGSVHRIVCTSIVGAFVSPSHRHSVGPSTEKQGERPAPGSAGVPPAVRPTPRRAYSTGLREAAGPARRRPAPGSARRRGAERPPGGRDARAPRGRQGATHPSRPGPPQHKRGLPAPALGSRGGGPFTGVREASTETNKAKSPCPLRFSRGSCEKALTPRPPLPMLGEGEDAAFMLRCCPIGHEPLRGEHTSG
jgi:hypothetical protein